MNSLTKKFYMDEKDGDEHLDVENAHDAED